MVIKSESKLITYYKGRHKKCYNHRIADWNDKTSGNWNRGYTWEEECIFIFVPKMSFKLNFLSNFENILWHCGMKLLSVVAEHCLSGRWWGGRAKQFIPLFILLSMYPFICFLRFQQAIMTNLDDKSFPIVNIFNQYHLQIESEKR